MIRELLRCVMSRDRKKYYQESSIKLAEGDIYELDIKTPARYASRS